MTLRLRSTKDRRYDAFPNGHVTISSMVKYTAYEHNALSLANSRDLSFPGLESNGWKLLDMFPGTALGCLLQDAREHEAWLELTAPELIYRIQAYSPEIRKPMTWLEHDRAGFAALFELLPKHHVDHAQWHRQAQVYQVRMEAAEARTITSPIV